MYHLGDPRQTGKVGQAGKVQSIKCTGSGTWIRVSLTSPDWRYDIHEEKIQFVVMLHFPIFLVVVVTDCPVTGTLLGGSGILETVMTALCQTGE